MALSPAEKSRRYRESLKAKAAAQRAKPLPDDVHELLDRPFSDFLKERDSNIQLFEILDYVGVHIAGDLLEEEHPIDRASEWLENGVELNSLNRAAAMVDVFIDAAKELSGLINQYKIAEVDRRLAMARGGNKHKLQELRKQLDKRTSHYFPVITIKGE